MVRVERRKRVDDKPRHRQLNFGEPTLLPFFGAA